VRALAHLPSTVGGFNATNCMSRTCSGCLSFAASSAPQVVGDSGRKMGEKAVEKSRKVKKNKRTGRHQRWCPLRVPRATLRASPHLNFTPFALIRGFWQSLRQRD